MKNQYFGDNRDLFKYDLVYQIMEERLADHFTFIPMLTEPDITRQGENRDRKKAKAGTENEELVSFLNGFKEKSKRDIKHLNSFFGKEAIEMTTYYGKNKYFSHEKRKEYFEQIADELLSKSLVLVDPDTGLEVDKSDKEHILYSEVKTLYDCMNRSSVLMIFQWISRFVPRVERSKYLRVKSQTLRDKVTKDLPILVSDGEIAFFFLTKTESVRESLSKVISDYKKSYPQLRL